MSINRPGDLAFNFLPLNRLMDYLCDGFQPCQFLASWAFPFLSYVKARDRQIDRRTERQTVTSAHCNALSPTGRGHQSIHSFIYSFIREVVQQSCLAVDVCAHNVSTCWTRSDSNVFYITVRDWVAPSRSDDIANPVLRPVLLLDTNGFSQYAQNAKIG